MEGEKEMYLLDRATKLEDGKKMIRSYLIEDDEVRYVIRAFQKWKGKKVSMVGTILMTGRVMLSNTMLEQKEVESFHNEQQNLVKKGCTTFAVAPQVSYERELDYVYRKTQHQLINSSIDFIIGCTIPIRLLTTRFLQQCCKRQIPFIRVQIDEIEQLKAIHWASISHTLLSYPIVLVPETNNRELMETWIHYCNDYRLHTSLPLVEGEAWDRALLQKVGLYPRKGTLAVGSSADYLLYPDNEEKLDEPTIVIMRGVIIKEGDVVKKKPGFGKQIEIRRPSQFLSIEYERLALVNSL